MQETHVGRGLLEMLLGMELVDRLGGNGGRVQVRGVKSSGSASLTQLGLGDLEVPDRGSACGPSSAENLVCLTVQPSKVRGGGIGGEQKNGFLINEHDMFSSHEHEPPGGPMSPPPLVFKAVLR